MTADKRVRLETEPDADEILAPAMDDLEQLGALAPNWDGCGSDPPTACARDTARTMLKLVADRFWRTAGRDIEPFTVGALPGSGVLLEWRGERASLEVDVGPHGEIGYLLVDRHGGGRRSEEADAVPLATIIDRLAHVLTPEA